MSGFLVCTKIKDVKDRGSEVQNKFAFKYFFFHRAWKSLPLTESLNDGYYRARNQSSVFVWKRAEKLYSLCNKPQVGFQKGLFKEVCDEPLFESE